MKNLLLILFCLMASVVFNQSNAQCTFVSPTVDINSTQTDGVGNCTVNFNLSFDLSTNNGNKFVFIHIWKLADYPGLTYSSGPTAAQLSADILNLVIDANLDALVSTYSIDPTVLVQSTANNPLITLTKTTYPLFYHYVISNVVLKLPGACGSSFTFKGDAWSTQANSSNPAVHCSMLGFGLGINDPLVSGVCVSAPPNGAYNYNISTQSSTLSFTDSIYLDNGDGIYDPNTDILISSVTNASPKTITPTTPFNSGVVSYPAAYNTLAYVNRSIFIVVSGVGKNYSQNQQIFPCTSAVYDYGDLPTTGSPSWPQAKVLLTGNFNTTSLKIDNTVTNNNIAVWAGNAVGVKSAPFTACTDAQNPPASCDPNDDGLGIPATINPGYTSTFTVTINGNLAGLVAYYGLWFDWNNNGDFTDDLDGNGNPAFYSGFAQTQSPRTVLLSVKSPLGMSKLFKARLIVSGSPITNTMFNSTTLVNGEVEDYLAPATIILPLSFANVTGVSKNCNIEIGFDAKNESNNRFFRIEQSANGTNWHVVSIFDTKGNGDNHYSFIDTKPNAGINYYRIQQVDANSVYTYSNTFTVNSNCNGAGAVLVYPNPVKNSITVNLPISMQNGVVKILNATGQILLTNTKMGNTQRTIDTQNLPVGTYILQVENDNKESFVQKIVKY